MVSMVDGYLPHRNDTRRTLLMLMVLAGLVLLITIINVANLLLARSSAQQREIAARTALGASRGRLIRQLLTESLLLAMAGGALGFQLPIWSREALSALRFGPVQMDSRAPSTWLTLDVRPGTVVVVFTVAVSVLAGLLFGLLPALRASKVSLASSLGIRGSGGEMGWHAAPWLRRKSDCRSC